VDELRVRGDDMEGITQHPRNRSLYVVEERLRQVVQFDTLGNEIARYPVDVEVRNQNDGLEGITIDPVTNRVFVVNEKNPRVLIELDVLRGFDRTGNTSLVHGSWRAGRCAWARSVRAVLR
jgi:uncharacterized protein YjiK